MKWFWAFLFAFLAFLVLLVALFRPDLLDAALVTTGVVLVALGYTIVAALERTVAALVKVLEVRL